MKRASYRHGVAWIAFNDETAERDVAVIETLISVALLADLFGKPEADVAKDVLCFREKHVHPADKGNG